MPNNSVNSVLDNSVIYILETALHVLPFAAPDATAVARLAQETAACGLLLADQACVALARRLALPTFTGDRIWAQVQEIVGVEVVLIR